MSHSNVQTAEVTRSNCSDAGGHFDITVVTLIETHLAFAA